MNNKPYWFLTRLEGVQRVYVYDQFWGKELTRMMKQGWKVVPMKLGALKSLREEI